MNKKLLVLLFLCLFVFSLGVLAEDHPKKGNPIRFVSYVYQNSRFAQYEPAIPNEYEYNINFLSLFSFDVFGSKDREALFFELRSPISIRWSDYQYRDVNTIAFIELISDIIPDDIVIWTGISQSFDTTNLEGNHGLELRPVYIKFLMTREDRASWIISYKGSGTVPDEIAIPLINDLMDNGFSCEISFVHKRLLGAELIQYNNLHLYVMEAIK